MLWRHIRRNTAQDLWMSKANVLSMLCGRVHNAERYLQADGEGLLFNASHQVTNKQLASTCPA
eukprot:scaffold368333_cov22-Prasinocladus_malaysianus.AAC.1